MKTYYFFAIMLFALGLRTNAQPEPDYQAIYQKYPYENLTVGRPCPDFELKNIHYYNQNEVSLSDLKGKNVILDFFNSSCVGCFKAMPKADKLKEKFGNDIDIFIVGLYDLKVEKIYEKYRAAFNLKIPVVYDSILPYRFVITGFPQYVWIDKSGIIRAITRSEDVNEDNVRAFIEGHSFAFTDITKADRLINERINGTSNSFSSPFVVYNSEASDGQKYQFRIDSDTSCMYKSEFGEWNIEQWGHDVMREPDIVSRGPNAGRAIEMFGPLKRLYFFAFFGITNIQPQDTVLHGRVSKKVILEGIDEKVFNTRKKNNYWYRLIDRRIRDIKKEDLLKTMQLDLHKYFGYEARIDDQMMPCYKIVVADSIKSRGLKSKGGTAKANVGAGGFMFKNIPWNAFVGNLEYYSAGFGDIDMSIIDETEIRGRIDITIDAAMQNQNDVRKALNKYGLDIIEGKKMMKVLIVRDPKGKVI